MLEMTLEEKKAFEWAIKQEYPSVAARMARLLAKYICRLSDAEHRDGAEGGQVSQTIPCPSCGAPRHVNRNIILPCQSCGSDHY